MAPAERRGPWRLGSFESIVVILPLEPASIARPDRPLARFS